MSKVIHINSSREKRIPDSFVQNENLSIESIGLGVYLNSLPKTYIPRPHLIREHFKFGERVWRKVSRELRQAGYLRLTKGAKGYGGSQLEFDINGNFESVNNNVE